MPATPGAVAPAALAAPTTRSTTASARRRSMSARRVSMRRKIWLLRLQEQDRMLAEWRGQLQWLLDSAGDAAPADAGRALLTLRMAMAGIRAAMDELADGAEPTEWLWRSAPAAHASQDEELFKVLAWAADAA